MIQVELLEPQTVSDTLSDLARERAGRVIRIPVAPSIQVLFVGCLASKPVWIIVLDAETGEGVKLTFGPRSSLAWSAAFGVDALTWLSKGLES